MLDCLLLPGRRLFSLTLGALLGFFLVALCLLGLALRLGRSQLQVVLALGCCRLLVLHSLRFCIPLALRLLLCLDARLLGSLVGDSLLALLLLLRLFLGAQPDQFGLFRLVLLLVGQGLAKSHQSGSLCPVRVGLELFQLLVDLQAVQVLDLGADQCGTHAGGVGVFDVRDHGLVRSDPGFLGGLPLIQRAADLVLKRFKRFAHPFAFGVDQLRDFLQFGRQLLAGVVQGHFRLGDLEGDRGDGGAPLCGAGVRHERHNLVADLLQPRLQAVRRAVHGQRGFLWWHGGQLSRCVHVHPLYVESPVQGTVRTISIQAEEVADLPDCCIDPHLGGLALCQSDRFPLGAPGGARLVVVEQVSR
ncbi:hypothetical protein D3C85_457150 [compost metagenome]